ncbi:hypothetical protein SCLCIDRAFT_1215908 [Scleroderma citrinum Foug A]|uniref:Uncharacterized protein n=1 Tax=Scleroderma citrinum Foug A TaxID=1036808 RepID=A0A0C2ZIJ6_9AGAM|nr:hypothetical protein SCLCIDRAFT_1215908 [Scleroderma citrinum Foug A]
MGPYHVLRTLELQTARHPLPMICVVKRIFTGVEDSIHAACARFDEARGKPAPEFKQEERRFVELVRPREREEEIESCCKSMESRHLVQSCHCLQSYLHKQQVITVV